MRHQKIDPAGCDDGANENCVSNSAAYSTNAPKSEARTIPPMPPIGSPQPGQPSLSDWKARLVEEGYFKRVEIVSGDIGPVAGIGSPLVCVGFGERWSCVWIDPHRIPWGWSDPYRVFLGDKLGGAVKYALELAKRVRIAAEREQERRERIAAERRGQ